MSNFDVTRTIEARPASEAAAAQPNRAPGADELKGLLSVIADQITTADRRHSNVLSEMRDRLTVLSEDTRAVRTQVTGDLGPVFTRIEDALGQLADRMGDVRTDQHAEPRFVPAAADGIGHNTAAAASSPGMAPAVLRSVPTSSEPQVFARAGEMGRAHSSTSPVDTFDVVDVSAPAGHSEPWDNDQAEALTRVYEDSTAALEAPDYDDAPLARGPVSYASDPGHHAGRDFDEAPRGMTQAFGSANHSNAPEHDMYANDAGAPHADGFSVSHADRDWLEARFSEIADRIERSLMAMSPEGPVESLGHRFDQFEQRFSEALHDVATRADVEGLRLIEGQIGELAGHVEQAHAQLARLDDIETQIGSVIQQIAGQTGHAQPLAAAYDPQDLERVAVMAAEQVVQRLPGAMQGGASDDASHDIRQLLETFITERRQGDDQTLAMLDTLQQALIRVLDRVDAIEISQHSGFAPAMMDPQAAAAPAYGAAAYAAPAFAGSAYGAPAADYHDDYAPHGRPMADPSVEPAGRSRSLGRGSAPAASHGSPFDDLNQDEIAPLAIDDQADDAGDGYAPDVAAYDRAYAADAQPGMAYASPPPLTDEPFTGAPAPSATGNFKPSIDKLRQDFIADAQRAKMKASSQTVAAPAADPDAVVLRGPAPAAARTTRNSVIADGAEASTPKSLFGMSPKIIAIALAAILAIGGAMLMMPGGSNAPEIEATATEEGAAPAPAPAATPAPGAAKSQPADAPKAASAAPAKTDPASAGSTSKMAPSAAEAAPKGSSAAPADSNRNAAPQRRSDLPVDGGEIGSAATADAAPLFAEPSDEADAAPVPDLVAASQGAIAGLRVQIADQAPSAEDFARIRQQQSVANMSGQLGAKATELMTPAAYLAETPGLPRAAMPDGHSQPNGATGMSSGSNLELPPATVGPLSLRLAAAKGDPSAQFEVGARLAEGKGTNQNFSEAMRWYHRAAAQGFAQAQYRLGTLYERGLGTKADLGYARDWYQRAAEQGNVKAMHNLAVLAAGNNGASGPDYQTASTWFMKAADRGLADSQYNLGVLFESGLGVGKDVKAAYKWFALAAKGGDKEAARRRDAVIAVLAANDKSEIDASVSNFHPVANDRLINDARAAGEDWKKRQGEDGNG